VPLVTIETRCWMNAERKKQVFDAIHEALVTAFRIPAQDRHQRILEFEPQDFEIPPGKSERCMLISLEVFAGRSVDAKRALYKEIIARLRRLDIAADDVLIVLREVTLESWGIRGGVPASDVDLGFKVQV
jgi:hypothetical protein